MTKTKKLLLIAGVVVLVVAFGVALALVALGGNEKTPGAQGGATATYTIEVKSASGILLKEVGLFVYEDSSRQELVTFIKTDESGAASFTDVERDTYVAVLDKVPTGYEAEEYYPLTGELTEIVLKTGTMENADMENLTYKLGDAIMDFSVTGPDGKEYTLSALFKGKKAVVLNFFYNNCQPCMLEFPFLQEAYAEFSDSVAVLAMNPVDGDDASVAALQKELGLTFPVVKCGEEWAKIMQLTAYPTTVIIDRFGNICLIHTGSVPDAKTFKDAFAYFAAEEYEQKLIENIEDLKVEEPEGTKENPTEIGGESSFEVTVEPGKEVYIELFKVIKKYLQIENENAYVIYNGETFKAQNGMVSLIVSAPDTFTPAKIAIGNSGKEKQTFKVYLGSLRGSFDNPYTMELGEVNVNVSAGNEQGVYYTYTPTEDGVLTLQCLSVTSGVKYGYSLFNTVSSAMRNLDEDAQTGADGAVTVSVSAKKGQPIQICVSTLPDGTNSYPAANFKFKATFTPGEVKDQIVLKKTEFSVTVRDDANQPVSNVNMMVVAKELAKQERELTPEDIQQPTGFATNQEGVAKFELLSGTYDGVLVVPDGYTAEKTKFQLTEAAPDVALKLTKIKKADYTVTVKGPDGAPVQNVFVRLGTGAWLTTDASGVVTENLAMDAYTVTIMIPEGYSGESNYTFEEGKTTLSITLGYSAGSEQNPINVEEYPFTTKKFSGGEELYYCFSRVEGMVGIAIRNADAYIRYGETTYGADAKGVVSFVFDPSDTAPVTLVVGNGGTERESYIVEAVHTPGSELNPYVVESYPYTTPAIGAGERAYFQFAKVDKVTGFSVADADVSVIYGETEYLPEEGVLTYSFIEIDEVLLVKNNAAAEKTFTFNAIVPPVGSEENPDHLTALKNETKKLEAGDADGYYYTYTSEKTGTFTLRLLQNISVGHDVELYTAQRYSLMSESGVTRQVSIDMEAGETVTIHIYTTGEFPTANFRMTLSFKEGAIEPLPSEPEGSDPTVPESSEPDPDVPGSSDPEETDPSQPEDEFAYTVTVTDIFGAGQSNVNVMFMKDGVPVKRVTTNKNGVAVMYTDVAENYTVELGFTGGKDYYYDKTAAVLTADNRNLTIKLIANVDINDSIPLYILNDNPAYVLYVGGTRVQLGTGKPNFSAEYENNCYFVFTPQTAGTYQITVTPNVELSFWGTDFVINKTTENTVDNVITFSISTGAVKHTTYVIGVKADTAVVDAVVNIARIGDPEFRIEDQPWTSWETGVAPSAAWKNEVGLKAMPGDAYYDLSKTPVYLDIAAASGTYNLHYDATGGYYRLGKGGPIILVNLNATGRYVPLYERVNGNGQYGGANVNRYFFDETGKFLSKEDYTTYLQQCFAEMNLDSINEKGYYPLTKDMMHVLQNGFCQWWDATSPNYLESFATANPEYAWLFACCYVQ